ncbi:hypothetical protein [Polymorphobacter sp.]|uniref:hypothetical protein n=1 Tax=Polymorphobacter sp. TaxID=1909290 RepID=UPI003F727EC1
MKGKAAEEPVPDASLVVRWLCHDMATPVATLLTASELLGDSGDAEINELITAAIRKLSARLRLVRLALGTASGGLAAGAMERLLNEALPDTPLQLSLDARTTPPSSQIAGAALVLSDLNRLSPLEIDADGARWTNGQLLPEAAAKAIAGDASDARAAMIALVAAQNRRAGLTLVAEPSGLGFRA